MERFFKVIRRVNSILFLLVLLGVGGCTIWYALYLYDWYQRAEHASAVDGGAVATDEEDARDPVSLMLGDAETVTGTDIQMLRLLAEDEYGRRRDQETRNILFLSASDHRGTWLFPGHENLILETDQIRPWRGDDLNAPTKALYIRFIPGDPEHAMGPSQYDPVAVALSRSDGTGLVEVLRDVDEVVSYEQFDADSLSITYRTLEELRLARISLDTFAKLSDDLVTAVPDQLGQ
jgi:hypothetical protein